MLSIHGSWQTVSQLLLSQSVKMQKTWPQETEIKNTFKSHRCCKSHLINFSNNYVPLARQCTHQPLQTLNIRSLWWKTKPPGVWQVRRRWTQQDWKSREKSCSESREEKSDSAFNMGSPGLMFKQLSVVQWNSEDVSTSKRNGDIIWIFVQWVPCRLQNKKRLESKSVAPPAVAAYQLTTLATTKGVDASKMKTPPSIMQNSVSNARTFDVKSRQLRLLYKTWSNIVDAIQFIMRLTDSLQWEGPIRNS